VADADIGDGLLTLFLCLTSVQPSIPASLSIR